MHWAAKYVGLPYRIGATGPNDFDCWGLVRTVLRERLGLELPQVSIGAAVNASAMREIAAGQGWGAIAEAPKEYDVLLMRSALGKHVTIAVQANGSLMYLHAEQGCGVSLVRNIEDFGKLGYTNIEVWRYAARK